LFLLLCEYIKNIYINPTTAPEVQKNLQPLAVADSIGVAFVPEGMSGTILGDTTYPLRRDHYFYLLFSLIL
jgi:hypothetical protein